MHAIENERKYMKRSVILSGTFAMLFSAMIILPALGTHHKNPQIWTGGEIKGLLIGSVVALLGILTIFYGVKMPAETKRKFTRVEWLIMLAILGVLAAVFLPLV